MSREVVTIDRCVVQAGAVEITGSGSRDCDSGHVGDEREVDEGIRLWRCERCGELRLVVQHPEALTVQGAE